MSWRNAAGLRLFGNTFLSRSAPAEGQRASDEGSWSLLVRPAPRSRLKNKEWPKTRQFGNCPPYCGAAILLLRSNPGMSHLVRRASVTLAFNSPTTWIRLCGVTAILLIVVASLVGALAQPRTDLGWQLEHFLGYSAATLIVCIGWPRPLMVAGGFVGLAALLELAQYFTPDRHPNAVAALCGAGGAAGAAAIAQLFIRARSKRRESSIEEALPEKPAE